MIDRHDINTYSKLALGAIFYLDESFKYINSALTSEFASILFSKELDSIEPSTEDREIINRLNIPDHPIGILQSDLPDALTSDTLQLLSLAWDKAMIRSKRESYKFDLKHKISSIELLGHLNNFGFFIEILINRHLLFLNQSKLIDSFSYNRISVAKVMERIIYIFKDELNSGIIQLNEITNLYSLRNKTVHFTPDNALALKPSLLELIQIWNQSVKILVKLEAKENFNEDKFSVRLTEYIKNVKEKWN
ncbi:MAG TPA: hypothetical protein VIH57_06465 [Bacteroidales bacterium]